MEQISLFD